MCWPCGRHRLFHLPTPVTPESLLLCPHAAAVPPTVAALARLHGLRSLELRGSGWLPQLGVTEPAAQVRGVAWRGWRREG